MVPSATFLRFDEANLYFSPCYSHVCARHLRINPSHAGSFFFPLFPHAIYPFHQVWSGRKRNNRGGGGGGKRGNFCQATQDVYNKTTLKGYSHKKWRSTFCTRATGFKYFLALLLNGTNKVLKKYLHFLNFLTNSLLQWLLRCFARKHSLKTVFSITPKSNQNQNSVTCKIFSADFLSCV